MIGIIGLGYVGLPLALQFARRGRAVIGLDIDARKVDQINLGDSYIQHIASQELRECIKSDCLRASTNFSELANCDSIIICVPTPLGNHREPDISYVVNTAETIAEYLQAGSLVVLESTTYPGTTEDELREVLEKGSGLVAGQGFYLAFSPEREDPGNPASSVATIPKVVGGFSSKCTLKAKELYETAIENVVVVSSCRAAEATKLLENIFRSVNIALVNELKTVYLKMGIDIWEVIDAAKTKPFGYMPFYPGPGLGGHCIPIDPFYLTWKAHEFEVPTRFIELAGEINTSMPNFVVDRTIAALNSVSKSVNGSRILVIGLAYKANVDDERESPAFALLSLLKDLGGQLDYYDPHIPIIKPTREHMAWSGKRSIAWSKEVIQSYDAIIVCTAHDAVCYEDLGEWAKLIVDTRNAMCGRSPKARVVKS